MKRSQEKRGRIFKAGEDVHAIKAAFRNAARRHFGRPQKGLCYFPSPVVLGVQWLLLLFLSLPVLPWYRTGLQPNVRIRFARFRRPKFFLAFPIFRELVPDSMLCVTAPRIKLLLTIDFGSDGIVLSFPNEIVGV